MAPCFGRCLQRPAYPRQRPQRGQAAERQAPDDLVEVEEDVLGAYHCRLLQREDLLVKVGMNSGLPDCDGVIITDAVKEDGAKELRCLSGPGTEVRLPVRTVGCVAHLPHHRRRDQPGPLFPGARQSDLQRSPVQDIQHQAHPAEDLSQSLVPVEACIGQRPAHGQLVVADPDEVLCLQGLRLPPQRARGQPNQGALPVGGRGGNHNARLGHLVDTQRLEQSHVQLLVRARELVDCRVFLVEPHELAGLEPHRPQHAHGKVPHALLAAVG
mmetsp:Transcript_21089/g.59656  ORF Transcript_21089/g.59656 Transcript_21089/m.59656 type:complete len:270 (-) Transcript_21089:410-1219(-)